MTADGFDFLTRVGAGTPMGNLFRRFWLPALLSSELPEPDGTPVRLRILSEDLVAFRDSDGKAGILSAFCPHKLAPLFFGRNEDGGLATSLAKNPAVSMLYRDSKARSTITVKGLGRIETDEAIKQKVWEMSPEVEQMHTPQRQGACLIVDIKEIRGSTTSGPVNVRM